MLWTGSWESLQGAGVGVELSHVGTSILLRGARLLDRSMAGAAEGGGVLWEGGDKKYEKRKPRLLEASPLGSAHPHILGCPILCLLNKTLSCN